jgi:hypothetical protein
VSIFPEVTGMRQQPDSSKRESNVAEEAAPIPFLTYGHDAVHMAALRCAELTKAGDRARLASKKKLLKNVRKTGSRKP